MATRTEKETIRRKRKFDEDSDSDSEIAMLSLFAKSAQRKGSDDQETIAELRASIKRKDEQIQAQKDLMSALRQTNSELEAKCELLKERIFSKTQTNAAKIETNTALRQTNTALTNSIEEQKATIKRLTETVKANEHIVQSIITVAQLFKLPNKSRIG